MFHPAKRECLTNAQVWTDGYCPLLSLSEEEEDEEEDEEEEIAASAVRRPTGSHPIVRNFKRKLMT